MSPLAVVVAVFGDIMDLGLATWAIAIPVMAAVALYPLILVALVRVSALAAVATTAPATTLITAQAVSLVWSGGSLVLLRRSGYVHLPPFLGAYLNFSFYKCCYSLGVLCHSGSVYQDIFEVVLEVCEWETPLSSTRLDHYLASPLIYTVNISVYEILA